MSGRKRPMRVAISVFFDVETVDGKEFSVQDGGYLVDEELERVRRIVFEAVKNATGMSVVNLTVCPPTDLWAGSDDPSYENAK